MAWKDSESQNLNFSVGVTRRLTVNRSRDERDGFMRARRVVDDEAESVTVGQQLEEERWWVNNRKELRLRHFFGSTL